LEENNFWHLIGGLLGTVVLFFVFLSALKLPLEIAVLIGLVPLAAALGYIFGLKQRRPPGFTSDLVDFLLHGPAFGPEPREKQPEHPTAQTDE
jgi:hypothetical protein